MKARDTIDLYATLADMKAVDYRSVLALTALIDLLVAKGIITREEMAERASQLDAAGEKSLPVGG
ncbi:hypothetical protein [Symbiobacterium thermophilum]|uniref:Uncharacterized protein n=2 Tax=Symbiobacterium thermophilum TaxID=2734 RepID=Q67K84_SYMTH|nr:hypothetical protein [Symbiobacterium thermophilum]MBY6275142.1 hypothetical protein [Symbiobacterium thermophilum]BAD41914.1 hypothetical protein STH2931 [Symbiobacterium thermophilum IAM 14863]